MQTIRRFALVSVSFLFLLKPISYNVHSNVTRCLVRRILALVFICALLLPGSAHSGQSAKILLINSYHHGFKWTDDIVSGVRSTLDKDDDLRIEYMDTRRIFSKEHLEKLYESFRIKFKNQRYDVIIVSDDPALELMLDVREELFPATPVVFCGINDFTDAKLKGKPLYTGVVEDMDLKSTLDIAHKLHPKARKVIASVNSNATGIANRRLLEKTIPLFKGILEFEIVQDPELAPFLERLKHLPKDEYIILLTGRFRSVKGEEIPINTSTPKIAETGIPAYSLWEFYLRHGIIGGKLTDGFDQGKTAGEIARRILSGEKNIPIVRESPNKYKFDFKELTRFGIDTGLLPSGSVMINEPVSFYARHHDAVWVAIAITLLGSVIIAFLSIVIMQKNEAQKELRRYQANLELMVEERTAALNTTNTALIAEINERHWAEEELQKVSKLQSVILNNSTVGIALVRNRVFEQVNKQMTELFGIPENQFQEASTRILYPNDEAYQRMGADAYPLLAQGKKATLENEMRKGDGSLFWCRLEGNALDASKPQEGSIWILQDITERKEAEEALLESEIKFKSFAEQALVGIYLLQDGVFRYVNSKFAQLFGYTVEECLNEMPFEKLIYAEDLNNVKEQIRKRISGEVEFVQYTFRGMKKNGQTFLVEIHGSSSIHKGRPAAAGVILDITDRKRAEEERENLISELQQALSEVNTLSGLLPICASCKKIRDDKGYWNQIESYIKARSRAEFSHGICPECAKRLYPEFYQEK